MCLKCRKIDGILFLVRKTKIKVRFVGWYSEGYEGTWRAILIFESNVKSVSNVMKHLFTASFF